MSILTTHRTRLIVTLLAGLLSYVALHAAEIRPAADAPRPKGPAESRRCFRLPEGFDIELVASEPLLAEVIAGVVFVDGVQQDAAA